MQYEINGCKITVIRKEEKEGITILEGLLNAIVLNETNRKDKNKCDTKKKEQ